MKLITNLTVKFKFFMSSLSLLVLSNFINAEEITLIGNITTDTTWSASSQYILDKPIFVTDGATLTIEAGTTIYGTEVDAGTFGSLIVTRGSRLMRLEQLKSRLCLLRLMRRQRIYP